MANPDILDFTGMTLRVKDLQVGHSDANDSGTALSSTELGLLDAKAAVAGYAAGGTTVDADVLAIPVTHAYVAKTTGADAEALTLADGTPGQILVISLVVDGGGTGTLTPTTAGGWVSCDFADAGDTLALMFIATTGWVILGAAGVAAPPAIALS